MPLSINTNVASMTAQRSFLQSNSTLEQAFERLSTGKRVNSAVDDAAGLAIGKDLEAKVSGLNQAIRNVNDGISMVQIAEGALSEVTDILMRMRDLSVQAANGSLGDTERGYLDTEQSKLATALDDAINKAKFNTTDLIDSDGTTFTIQSGANAGETTSISIDGLTAAGMAVSAAQVSLTGQEIVSIQGVAVVTAGGAVSDKYTFTDGTNNYVTAAANYTSLSQIATALNAATGDSSNNTLVTDGMTASVVNGEIVITYTATTDQGEATSDYDLTYSTGTGTGGSDASGATIVQNGATYGIAAIQSALDTIASDRATLGAIQAQLESTVRNLSNVAENTAAAAGRIMDTDYAAETANLTKAQILQQAATSVLAQANAQPQAVLALLQ
ncbi:MAG TPA: flagellin [Halieaceae bacterium]|nr:flagellin [Halieaceae bacterium]